MSQFRRFPRVPTRVSNSKSASESLPCKSRSILSLLLLIQLTLGAAGCEKRSDTPVDPSINPPVLLQASTSLSAINTDTINVGTIRKPEDLLSITLQVAARLAQNFAQSPLTVHTRVVKPIDYVSAAVADLYDDGSRDDQTKGDGVYTGGLTFEIQRVEVGTFNIEVQAIGTTGYQSNTIILPLVIYRGNHTPTVTLLEAADTVLLRSESQLLSLRLNVTDEDGIADISRVIFNSFKPDGVASSGNPFQMFDDGAATHGDEKAGDGVFTLLVTLPPTTQPGTYRFEFQAFDRSNASSDLLTHRITVKP